MPLKSYMKFFILLAIIFFSYRIFANDNVQYYESRYYNIDEYIRFENDPNYDSYLKAKKADLKNQRKGVDEYKADKEREAAKQEKSRLQHLALLEKQEKGHDFEKLEAEYEKQKQKEYQKYLKLQAQYLAEKDSQEAKTKPSRSIASFKAFGNEPIKRVPRHKRKYISHKKNNSAK